MKKQLSCNQVMALINFYAENSLSEILSKYIKIHLDNCPSCMAKYIEIKEIIDKCYEKQEQENPYINKQYENFKDNLSAYIDNELEDSENIKIKKITIANPLARKDLENIYKYKKLLSSAFEKTKNDLKYDYSKTIIGNLGNKYILKKIDPFYKLSVAFLLMIFIILTGILKVLYLQ